MAQQEFTQHFPQPGWVEHDPEEILSTQMATAREAVASAGLTMADMAAIGITNQRETTVVWDRATGKAIHNAIVWQDRRTAETCDRIRESGAAADIRQRTGLELDAYFSGTKAAWILDHVDGARDRAERGELALGTVDLAGSSGTSQEEPCMPPTPRTLPAPSCTTSTTWPGTRSCWTSLGCLNPCCPKSRPSSGDFGLATALFGEGALRIAGVAGDQQSALFGQQVHRSWHGQKHLRNGVLSCS